MDRSFLRPRGLMLDVSAKAGKNRPMMANLMMMTWGTMPVKCKVKAVTKVPYIHCVTIPVLANPRGQKL